MKIIEPLRCMWGLLLGRLSFLAPSRTFRRRFRRVGRNDPCPCRSGFKYKRCCLNRSRTGNKV